jgi:ubiquinone/menaquinone biosynthesis C-methylase UbiE
MAQSRKPTELKQPVRPDRYFATFRAQAGAAVAVGLFAEFLQHKEVLNTTDLVVPIASTIGAFIILNAFRTILLIPPPEETVHEPEPAQLTESITSAIRSSYAVSANWLSLWSRPNFRYYLHLDAVAALIAYSFRFGSSLSRISRDESDVATFLKDTDDILDEIVSGDGPVYKHRLRLLIYPQWVYKLHRSEIEQLIRSHSAARISCVPLIADRLYDALSHDERAAVRNLNMALRQTTLDKNPPRARLIRLYIEARLRIGLKLPTAWKVTFPDFLVVDADLPHDTSSTWWYSSDSDEVKHARHDDKRGDVFDKAVEVFRMLCSHKADAIWDNYGYEALGGVVVRTAATRLESEAFFDRDHYASWQGWIAQHRHADTNAAHLNEWFETESRMLEAFVAKVLSDLRAEGHDRQVPVKLLDIGCGAGDDIVEVLEAHEEMHASGVDIIESNIRRANAKVHDAELVGRVTLVMGDAATLVDFGDEEFDMAICMTNTLGNMTPEKQEGCLQRLREVLTPNGRALISVYSEASIGAREATYEAIGLHVQKRPDCLLATEGLRSQHFDMGTLRALVERCGLSVVGEIGHVANIGLAAVVRPTL